MIMLIENDKNFDCKRCIYNGHGFCGIRRHNIDSSIDECEVYIPIKNSNKNNPLIPKSVDVCDMAEIWERNN